MRVPKKYSRDYFFGAQQFCVEGRLMADINSAASGNEKMFQEIITHINSIEIKINTLKEEIEEQNDLQTVNRLDIISIKNEMDKMKMSLPVASPDFAENIKNIQKLMEKKDNTSAFEKMMDDVEQLKKQMHGMKPEAIDELRGEISSLYDSIGQPSASGQEIADIRRRLDELEKSPNTDRKPAARCRKCGAPMSAAAKFCGRCGKKAE